MREYDWCFARSREVKIQALNDRLRKYVIEGKVRKAQRLMKKIRAVS